MLSAETPVAELWNRCCEQILELCDAQCATIAICDPRGDYTLHVVDRISGVLISAPIDQESTLAQVLSCGETVVRYDEQNRCIGVPVRFGHVLLGAISVEGIADFDADLVSLLESCALYVAARIDYENVLQSSERYEELALSDGLTGIANRRRFDEALANEWRRAARERKPLAILMIDVDYFKKFNDEYGHDAGDVCLKQIARVIESCVRRPADIAARYGGEEFVILLPSTDQAGGVALGEALLAGVAELAMPHTESAVRHVTISIGVASTIPTAQTQAEVFLRAADRALYEAKHAGRNCLRVAAVRENLPVPATSFVGRKSELADVAHILETHPLLTITGAGGAGKTRLA
ncbi:MAG TPA: diguanylate cyclase, partial [Candidatus Baltobacteraceae bacterium]